MAVQHSNTTDPNIHEPKGVAAANADEVYIANGAGSGSWRAIHPHSSFYYDNIGTGTTYTTPTAYTVINMTTTGDPDPTEFTHNGSGRLTYTGTSTIDININASITLKHSAGSGQDCFFQVFKNGVAVAGAQHVVTADSANYHHITLAIHAGNAATNDYFEIYCKVSSGNIIIHSYSCQATGIIT